MENFIISIAGVRVPRIFYGTGWKKSDTGSLVRAAIRRGFRGIDTACQPKHYHEPGVGAGVAACFARGREASPHAGANSVSLSDTDRGGAVDGDAQRDTHARGSGHFEFELSELERRTMDAVF
jgi:hypothetical protein